MLHNATQVIQQLNQVRPRLKNVCTFEYNEFIKELYDLLDFTTIMIGINDRESLIRSIKCLNILNKRLTEISTTGLYELLISRKINKNNYLYFVQENNNLSDDILNVIQVILNSIVKEN